MGSVMEHKRYRNIKNNLQAVKGRVIYPSAPFYPPMPVSIVCYGPSLRDTWHQIHPVNPIVSVSKAHDFLVEHGIAPTIHVEFDCRSHKARHIQHAATKPSTTWLPAFIQTLLKRPSTVPPTSGTPTSGQSKTKTLSPPTSPTLGSSPAGEVWGSGQSSSSTPSGSVTLTFTGWTVRSLTTDERNGLVLTLEPPKESGTS